MPKKYYTHWVAKKIIYHIVYLYYLYGSGSIGIETGDVFGIFYTSQLLLIRVITLSNLMYFCLRWRSDWVGSSDDWGLNEHTIEWKGKKQQPPRTLLRRKAMVQADCDWTRIYAILGHIHVIYCPTKLLYDWVKRLEATANFTLKWYSWSKLFGQCNNILKSDYNFDQQIHMYIKRSILSTTTTTTKKHLAANAMRFMKCSMYSNASCVASVSIKCYLLDIFSRLIFPKRATNNNTYRYRYSHWVVRKWEIGRRNVSLDCLHLNS